MDNIIINSKNLRVIDLKYGSSNFLNCYELNTPEGIYYFKKFSGNRQIINELIGTYLANIFNLETIRYELCLIQSKYDVQTGLLSKNFKKENKEYFSLRNVPYYQEKCIDYLSIKNLENLVHCMNDDRIDYNKLLLQIYKMIILDFYSHQVDRHYENIMFEREKGVYRLAPLYDYEASFDVSEDELFSYYDNKNYMENLLYTYGSDILKLCFPSRELYQVFSDYPQIYYEFTKILSIDLEKILISIEKEYGISIPCKLREEYQRFDSRQKEFVHIIK